MAGEPAQAPLARTGRLFFAAVGLGVLLSVVNPRFLPFVAAGTLIGLAPLIVGWVRQRPQPRNVWLALALVVLIASGPFVCGAGKGGPAQIDVKTTYFATAALSGDPERLSIQEELFIMSTDVDAAGKTAERYPEIFKRKAPVTDLLTAHENDIKEALLTRGWSFKPRTGGMAFSRERENDINVPTLRGERGNSIKVPHIDFPTTPTSSYVIQLDPSEDSRVIIAADRYAIGGTYPDGKRQKRQVRDEEEITVPLPEIGDEIEMRVRHPWLRNGIGSGAANLTFNSVFSWLLLAAIAVANDAVKDFIKRLYRRILRRPAPAQAPG